MSGFSAGIRTIFAYGFSTIYARENTEEMLPLDFAVEGYYSTIDESEENGEEPMVELNEGSEVVEEADQPPAPDAHSQPRGKLTEQALEFRRCIDLLLMSALYDRPVLAPIGSGQRGMPFLPLHGAAASQPCRRSWKRIKSMYGQDYAGDVDVRGRTALHILVTSQISNLELVTDMVTDIDLLDPTSITTFDDSGLLPLHASLIHLAPYAIVERLLKCNGSSITAKVDEDCDHVQFRGMLPFQLAAASGCCLAVIHLLLRAHPMGVIGAV